MTAHSSRFFALFAFATLALSAQTMLNLATQGSNMDFSAQPFTLPVAVGPTPPLTCKVGQLFFSSIAINGQNLYACTPANTWTMVGGYPALPTFPAGAIVGTTDPQTLTNKRIDGSEITTGVIPPSVIPPFSGDINTVGMTATLAAVNPVPGTFGDASHNLTVTVDAKGRITSITQVTSLQGQSIVSSVPTGALASIPVTCPLGALYVATDQPTAQQLYTCSAQNVWTQNLSVGPSGALAVTNGSLDIVPAVVPLLDQTNAFTGLNSFPAIQLTGATQPTCSAAMRGTFWFVNGGSAADAVQVCVFNGSSYAWNALMLSGSGGLTGIAPVVLISK